ncbi:MAG: TetR/AcrR family transcriptional regulator [Acidimicrobiales bacterium]|nr:TetR/AcrR family transcriptional regulator [Acidimicrobiales bacterium]
MLRDVDIPAYQLGTSPTPVADAPVQRLPRGRHGLTRDEVETSQRLRMLVAMADAMMDKGYVGTSVADVIKRAGVSRETFYQQFSSKADCFSATFDAAADAVLGAIAADLRVDLADLDSAQDADQAVRYGRFEQAFTAYLEALATHPAYARLFLVEVYAAGPEAIARRSAVQGRIVDLVARMLDVTTAHGRFACEVLVAAVGAMVTEPLVSQDVDALRALHAPVVDLVRRALDVEPG